MRICTIPFDGENQVVGKNPFDGTPWEERREISPTTARQGHGRSAATGSELHKTRHDTVGRNRKPAHANRRDTILPCGPADIPLPTFRGQGCVLLSIPACNIRRGTAYPKMHEGFTFVNTSPSCTEVFRAGLHILPSHTGICGTRSSTSMAGLQPKFPTSGCIL